LGRKGSRRGYFERIYYENKVCICPMLVIWLKMAADENIKGLVTKIA
jgi:hypothetical protein